MAVGRCELCGAPTSATVNGLGFCPAHDTDMFRHAARLDAWQQGAPTQIIAWAGDMAVEFARRVRCDNN